MLLPQSLKHLNRQLRLVLQLKKNKHNKVPRARQIKHSNSKL